MQFEARKIIDLQGEAAVCEDRQEASSENCKAMSRDVITLKVRWECILEHYCLSFLGENGVFRKLPCRSLPG